MIPSEILDLEDKEAPTRARAAWETANGRVIAAEGEIARHEAALAESKAAIAALARQAGRGAPVTDAARQSAVSAIAEAEAGLRFWQEAHVAATAGRNAADAEMRNATAASWQPVLHAGIAIRMRAAALVVEAKSALRAAEEAFELGKDTVEYAVRSGADLKLGISIARNPEALRLALAPETINPRFESETFAAHSFEVPAVVNRLFGDAA
jgi:hypothetical protein